MRSDKESKSVFAFDKHMMSRSRPPKINTRGGKALRKNSLGKSQNVQCLSEENPRERHNTQIDNLVNKSDSGSPFEDSFEDLGGNAIENY